MATANQISLMTYLQYGPPVVPVLSEGQSTQNTRNDAYNGNQIVGVGHWAAFNLGTIQQQYGQLLAAARLPAEPPLPPSPPRPINSEAGVRARIDTYLSNRVIRGLRHGFGHLQNNNQLGNRTVVTKDVGSMAQTIQNYTPDFAYFDSTILPTSARPNRLPGDAKPSFKWSYNLGNQSNPTALYEFRQALSQVNFYVMQHHTRYGFIITDGELVAIRRLDRNGNLELATPIQWNTAGTVAQPRLTVALGLWYLVGESCGIGDPSLSSDEVLDASGAKA